MPVEAVEESYQKEVTDEFVSPTVVIERVHKLLLKEQIPLSSSISALTGREKLPELL